MGMWFTSAIEERKPFIFVIPISLTEMGGPLLCWALWLRAGLRQFPCDGPMSSHSLAWQVRFECLSGFLGLVSLATCWIFLLVHQVFL